LEKPSTQIPWIRFYEYGNERLFDLLTLFTGMDVSFSGLLSYIEERADKLLNSGEYNKAANPLSFLSISVFWIRMDPDCWLLNPKSYETDYK
jgi:tRNA A37 threonylcarbamoyltransferase TsaD